MDNPGHQIRMQQELGMEVDQAALTLRLLDEIQVREPFGERPQRPNRPKRKNVDGMRRRFRPSQPQPERPVQRRGPPNKRAPKPDLSVKHGNSKSEDGISEEKSQRRRGGPDGRACRCKCQCAKNFRVWYRVQGKAEYGARLGHWLSKRGKRQKSRMLFHEKRMYEKIFELFDADGSGALDFGEISIALRLVGLDAQHMRRIIEENSNEEGELDFAGFLHVIETSSFLQGQGDTGTARSGSKRKGKDKKDETLPFNLFLPAFSRKKNVEFVMALELKGDAGLPYPLEPTSFMSKDKSIKQKPNGAAVAPCPVCSHPPTRLVEIAHGLA